ncbi:deleted in malignant brain tumors 1 protein-like isoform X2 [Corythoichthys intestinalis]|nr:deleted in malignant brain tumors 1 protein-like isoform X2 [Corythoichthys intestinalis]
MWTLLVVCGIAILRGVKGDGDVNDIMFYTTPDQPSCRFNCDRNMGSCSCSSSCEYYGRCCHDYYQYCYATTTVLPTSQLSCRSNCGRHLGSCSCSSSCRYYYNCCHDYNEYCDSTTYMPATALPSCRFNCGRDMGICSCSSSCEYQVGCCHGYYEYCYSTTYMPTTAQPSCRYNCGRHMGSCSCSSSCQFYGNCCDDYYEYCYSTTHMPTTAQPSCRFNCGRYMGSCSCSSSCRFYGSCCDDYYEYCYSTTDMPSTVGPCGDSMFGSGAFSSPRHPNYYYNNAYCVWHLRVPHNQRVFLEFSYLELQSCCSCDYISIHDGPFANSRLLGKVCNDNNNNSFNFFYSTSYEMTVVFRSDRSVVGRGFRAEFTSALPQDSGKVNCSSDVMNIVIGRKYLNSLGYDGHNIYLNDQNCRPQIFMKEVVFNFRVYSCGTSRKFENGRVVYTNAVRGFTTSYGDVTRKANLKINVVCQMDQYSESQIMYLAQNHDNTSITGTGMFNTSMDFYTSSSFFYKVDEFPYKVSLNQDIYVQVDLSSSISFYMDIFLDTCLASPSPNNFHTTTYYLVRNG